MTATPTRAPTATATLISTVHPNAQVLRVSAYLLTAQRFVTGVSRLVEIKQVDTRPP
jgi:hypothetical protein